MIAAWRARRPRGAGGAASAAISHPPPLPLPAPSPRGLRRPPPRPPPSQGTRPLGARPHPLPRTGSGRAPRRQRGAPAALREARGRCAPPWGGEAPRAPDPASRPRPRSLPGRRVLEGFHPCRVPRGRPRLAAFIMYFFPPVPAFMPACLRRSPAGLVAHGGRDLGEGLRLGGNQESFHDSLLEGMLIGLRRARRKSRVRTFF